MPIVAEIPTPGCTTSREIAPAHEDGEACRQVRSKRCAGDLIKGAGNPHAKSRKSCY